MRKGFALPLVIVLIIILGIVGFLGYLMYWHNNTPFKKAETKLQNGTLTLSSPSPSPLKLLQFQTLAEKHEKVVSLKVLQLKTNYANTQYGEPFHYFSSTSVVLSELFADKVAAYGVSEKVIIGPKNWTGTGTIGTDGGRNIELYPAGGSTKNGPSIKVYDACVNCGLEHAAPFFEDAKNKVEKDFPNTVKKIDGLQVKLISPKIIKYSLPNKNDGEIVRGIAYYDPNIQLYSKPIPPRFIQMECVFPANQDDYFEYLLDLYIHREGGSL